MKYVIAPRMKINFKPGIPLQDVLKMVDACKGKEAPRDRAILLFLVETGVLAREMIALNINDVNLISGYIQN